MSSFDINAAYSTRENYDGESPEGLEDYLAAVEEQMWAKGELAHAIASGEAPDMNNMVVLTQSTLRRQNAAVFLLLPTY